MNEMRKRDIAIGLFEYDNLTNRERQRCVDPLQLRKISETR